MERHVGLPAGLGRPFGHRSHQSARPGAGPAAAVHAALGARDPAAVAVLKLAGFEDDGETLTVKLVRLDVFARILWALEEIKKA